MLVEVPTFVKWEVSRFPIKLRNTEVISMDLLRSRWKSENKVFSVLTTCMLKTYVLVHFIS